MKPHELVLHEQAQATLVLPGPMGFAVIGFAFRMYHKLKAHEPAKGGREGWVHDAPGALLSRVKEEVVELSDRLRQLKKRPAMTGDPAQLKVLAADEAVDVGNMVMMVADVLIDLVGKESGGDGKLHKNCVSCGQPLEGLRDHRCVTDAPPVSAKRKDDQPVGGPVNHPKHYNKGGIEVIEVIKAFGWCVPFCLGNTVKYVLRAEHKANAIEDLEKARWYLDYAITHLKAQVKP